MVFFNSTSMSWHKNYAFLCEPKKTHTTLVYCVWGYHNFSSCYPWNVYPVSVRTHTHTPSNINMPKEDLVNHIHIRTLRMDQERERERVRETGVKRPTLSYTYMYLHPLGRFPFFKKYRRNCKLNRTRKNPLYQEFILVTH